MLQPLGRLDLERVVPGIPIRGTLERRDAVPLWIRAQCLEKGLGGWEPRVDVIGICKVRETGPGQRAN